MSISASLLENPAAINERIQELEKQRTSLHNESENGTHTATSEADLAKANELSNNLHLAIRNNDLATLDALITSFGEIPSLKRARDLVKFKATLEKERFYQIEYTEIQQQLNNNILEFDFEKLYAIKQQIDGLDSDVFRDKARAQLINIIQSFKPDLTETFKESINESKWLQTGVITEDIKRNFTNLINLQSLALEDETPLWAFEILSSNFKISFDYHFNTHQETNRIDKPELFFTYHLNYLDQHLSKINKVWSLHHTNLSHLFAHTEYIKASLSPIIDKFEKILKVIRDNTEDSSSTDILIHLINETLQYDEKLIKSFYYDPLNDGKWAGLFQRFEYNDLEKWLIREIQINQNTFENIVNSQNCFHIDYTSVNQSDLKPTISAIKLKILFENITKTFSKIFRPYYSSLSQVSKFKLKFFSKVYLNILNLYLARLVDGYDAFNELFKSRKSAYKTAGIDISGTNGLERIFRIYGSIKFISNSLRLWNQEPVFIELNQLFNQFSGSLQTTSLFTSILKEYKSLEIKTWSLLESFITKAIQSLSKNYTSINNWGSELSNTDLSVSNEILPIIDVLNEYNLFINKIIPPRQSKILQNHISLEISDLFFNSIIKSNHFNPARVNQLSLDVHTIWEKASLSTGFPLYFKLIEALKVLSLTESQASQFTNFTLSQYAKNGEYSDIREFLSLQFLGDNDILDILLRVR